ncbi:MAG TPA: alpha-glucosidase [Aggregatilineales bacterium]|nr:alpha-glucosidase [Aggregatilineales bacterium]
MTVPTWWQDAVGYQIYPRSFADSSADGIGDLPGILEKLDYLQWAGITAIWLSPFYPSPLIDVGYDISDHIAVAPEYGTLQDFDRLVNDAHRRGIRIIVDVILNHTSDQHRWFLQSKSSRDNFYRDWYIWRDGKAGSPPNDWEAMFGGSAWKYDENTDQYYYHYFLPEQPDLNWRNPAVKKAMFDVVRFWLNRGVDGIRLDAISTVFENEDFPDANVNVSILDIWKKRLSGHRHTWASEFFEKMRYQLMQPENFDLFRELRKMVSREYKDRVLIGEAWETEYYVNGKGVHSLFNFDLTDIGKPDAPAVRRMLKTRLPALPGNAWECNTIGNHDRTRSFELFKDGKHDRRRYEIGLATVMLLRGTPMYYYGEEIAMRDYLMPDIEHFTDGLGVWAYHELIAMGMDEKTALIESQKPGRDKCRTPMQWENAPNARFSPEGVKTWLPVNPDYADGINVAAQRSQRDSILHYFRELVQLRHEYITLRRGDFQLIDRTGDVLAFWRRSPAQTCIVAMNMSAEPVTYSAGMLRVRRVYSNYDGLVPENKITRLGLAYDLAGLILRPYEVFVGLT